jgi:signal transduction histidine kinase
MSTYSQMLIESYAGKVLDEAGQEYARRVAEAARRMDALVQDLLEYSRISRVDMASGPVPLGDLMSEVLTSMAGELNRLGAMVVVDPDLPSVRGNRATLARVLTNLLSNAAKFVAAGTPPRIHVGSETRDAWVRLWVEDNGIGIPPEHRELVFGVFERLHQQKAYAGTGIGLAIVRKAMERMGCRVGVDSEVGKGSRFWIELPKEQDQATHERN